MRIWTMAPWLSLHVYQITPKPPPEVARTLGSRQPAIYEPVENRWNFLDQTAKKQASLVVAEYLSIKLRIQAVSQTQLKSSRALSCFSRIAHYAAGHYPAERVAPEPPAQRRRRWAMKLKPGGSTHLLCSPCRSTRHPYHSGGDAADDDKNRGDRSSVRDESLPW